MCTVTYLPLSTGVVLTSNRDESQQRQFAFAPHVEKLRELKLTYPKDPKAGGSWIAAKSNGDAAVILNGAFEKHEKQPAYRMSRGLVLLEVIKALFPLRYFEEVDLKGIENFTLILFTQSQLFECRWDGMRKHIIAKNEMKAHIWSSATLYNEEVQKQRSKWFFKWLANEAEINSSKIIDFHQTAGRGDSENGLVMARDNGISTCSITSIFIQPTTTSLRYHDLKNNTFYNQDLSKSPKKVTSTWFERAVLPLKIMIIKTLNWEYWPIHVFYFPMYFYWLYLSVKARSIFFFSTVNPLRKHAGFVLERKSDVYAYIPTGYYPKTIVCPNMISPTELKMRIDEQALQFPLIAKPDMGERGIRVALINTFAELVMYSVNSTVDFLVQEFIDYSFEVGIFYYRIPGESVGKISGIVGKELLSVTGDGKSTIAMLLKKDARYLLQLQTLEQLHGSSLDLILENNEQKLLVPYGNHCRGAKFIDLSDKITCQLTKVIDTLCKHIPEFYFGRLDLKFNSWKELYEGKNFAVIELNGAASEPAHIYDPKHSIFFAWKEIKKHWDILYRISQINASEKGLKLMGITEGVKMLADHMKYRKNLSKNV